MKPNNVCRHLRTKKMYIPAQAEEVFAATESKLSDSPGHCWCNRTLTEVGPDDRQVDVSLCNPGRSCFEE